MWELSEPWWTFVLRAFVIYGVLLVLLRILGKKPIGRFSPFDFILLLIISEGVSGALIGDDTSLSGGIIIAVTLCALNYLVDKLVFYSRSFETVLEGEPRMLIKNGQIVEKTKHDESITDKELQAALRQHGVDELNQVAYAVLESDGHINVIKKKDTIKPNQS